MEVPFGNRVIGINLCNLSQPMSMTTSMRQAVLTTSAKIWGGSPKPRTKTFMRIFRV